jgi:hypothetical protein
MSVGEGSAPVPSRDCTNTVKKNRFATAFEFTTISLRQVFCEA